MFEKYITVQIDRLSFPGSCHKKKESGWTAQQLSTCLSGFLSDLNVKVTMMLQIVTVTEFLTSFTSYTRYIYKNNFFEFQKLRLNEKLGLNEMQGFHLTVGRLQLSLENSLFWFWFWFLGSHYLCLAVVGAYFTCSWY